MATNKRPLNNGESSDAAANKRPSQEDSDAKIYLQFCIEKGGVPTERNTRGNANEKKLKLR
jgi:hypothetical protein